MKDISFIIPVYNAPLDKLEECICSILKIKSKFDIEIVVIDDGSEGYIKEFFEEKFIEEVIYKYKANGGVSSARNAGLDIAEGKFVFFADADDKIIADAFEKMDLIDKYQFIIFDIDVIENSKESTWKVLNCEPGKLQREEVIEELLTSNRMNSPCSKLFLYECIKRNNIRFDESMITGEDLNFVIDFTKCVTDIYYTGKNAYCYQREEASRIARIRKFPETYLDNISFLRDKLEGLIYEYGLEGKYADLLNMDHTESLYNYLSDLMTLKMCTPARKARVYDEIKRVKINCAVGSRKMRMKYHLIRHRRWALMYVLAYIRKQYLKLK